MKVLICFFISSFYSLIGVSQTNFTFQNEQNENLENVHIILHDISNKKDTLLLSDKNGKIQFDKSDNKTYKIHAALLGYISITDSIKNTQSKTYILYKEVITINEVIITAQYSPNSTEKAVHKVKVIDRKKIDAMGAQNLRDVLSNEMNVRISQDNVLGSSMSLQGISGQNVKILIDGVAVNGRLNGNIDISQINMNNVERIEVIEGPLSVNYGTDALAGTINIITKKIQKKSFEFGANSFYESCGNYNFSGRIGFGLKKTSLNLSGGRNYFDGWRTYDKPFSYEKVRVADSNRFQSWKPKEQFFGTMNLGRQFKNIHTGYCFDYFQEEIVNKGFPRKPYFETAFDDYYVTNRINHSVTVNGNISKNYRINIVAGNNHFVRTKNTYFKDLTTLEEKLVSNSGDQDTSTFNDVTFRGCISYIKDSTLFNYELGYDIHNEMGKGARIKNNQKEIGDYALFGSAEYKSLKKLIIRPGIRVLYNTSYKAPIIPSLNVKFDLNDKFTIRASYAKGFRAPSVKDLYFFFVDVNHYIVGNPDLKAEISNNYNLSWNYSKKINQNSLLKIDNSFYYNDIDNMISLAVSQGNQYSYFNIDQFKTLGVQIQGELSIKHLKFTLGGSYIGRYNQLHSEFLTEKFIYAPEGKCNVFYEWKKQQMTFAFFYKYTGALPGYALDENNTLIKTKINAYNMADISLSKAFLKRRMSLTIGSKNLFNVTNITGIGSTSSAHSSASGSVSIGMGRTYYCKLSINLNSKK